MKIGQPTEPLRADRLDAGAERAKGTSAGRAATGATGATDTVALSAASRTLGTAGDDIDVEKVERVRQAIEQGTFKVDAGRVADRLIDQSIELTGRAKG